MAENNLQSGGKQELARLWTHTNPETGEKDPRIHKKDLPIEEAMNPASEAGANVSIDEANNATNNENTNDNDGSNENSNTTTQENQKEMLSRMWTHTNPATGEKEARIHKKDDNEAGAEAAGTEARQEESKQEQQQESQETEKVAMERLWTHTNPETQEKEARLHRKEDDNDDNGNDNSNNNNNDDDNGNGNTAENTTNTNEDVQQEAGNNEDSSKQEINDEANAEAGQQDKDRLARAWTHTNQETGEKEARIHRKEENEVCCVMFFDVFSLIFCFFFFPKTPSVAVSCTNFFCFLLAMSYQTGFSVFSPVKHKYKTKKQKFMYVACFCHCSFFLCVSVIQHFHNTCVVLILCKLAVGIF